MNRVEEFHLWDKDLLVKELRDTKAEVEDLLIRCERLDKAYNSKLHYFEQQNAALLKVLTNQKLLDTTPKYVCMSCSKNLGYIPKLERSDEENG